MEGGGNGGFIYIVESVGRARLEKDLWDRLLGDQTIQKLRVGDIVDNRHCTKSVKGFCPTMTLINNLLK